MVRKIGNMTNRFANLDRPGVDAVQLRASLAGGHGPYARFEGVEETGSTNVDLAAAATADPGAWPDLSVLSAEHQTAAKGRLDRRWSAPARSAVSVSVLLRPRGPSGAGLHLDSLAWLSLLAATALARTLTEQAGVEAKIKWPNDVQISGRKVAGVLAHMVPATGGQPAAVVVGTGLNVSIGAEELPHPNATSLLLEKASTTNRNILLKAYLRSMAGLYGRFCAAGGDAEAPLEGTFSLRQMTAARMVTIGQQVRAELPGGDCLVGVAEGLDRSGALMITDDGGTTHSVSAADVVHLRPDTV